MGRHTAGGAGGAIVNVSSRAADIGGAHEYVDYAAAKGGHKAVFDLRVDLYYHILRMSASFFQRNQSGSIVSRLISDVQLVKKKSSVIMQ